MRFLNALSEASSLIAARIIVQDVKTQYNLTEEETEKVDEHLRSVWKGESRIQQIFELELALLRCTFSDFTFEEDIDKPKPEEGAEEWSFIADLPDMYRTIFFDCKDNYEATDLLNREGVFSNTGISDPESFCSYFYFKSEREAQDFIDRLNVFCRKRLEENCQGELKCNMMA